MTPEKLVRMANQIAIFFDSQPGQSAVGDGAAAEVANHIVKFWEPRMIDHLRAHATTGGGGLRPSVMAAVPLLPESGAEAPRQKRTAEITQQNLRQS